MTKGRIDFSSCRVLVVGDVMLDRYWFGEVSRISPEAPVPVVRVARSEERLGGAANVARNLTSIGAQAMLIGVVGDDEPGRQIEALAATARIDARLIRDAELPTTIKLRVIGRNQQLLRIDFERPPGAAAIARREATFAQALPQAQVVVLSDYGKGALTGVGRLIADAKAAGRLVIADPKGDDYERYHGVDVLTPNRSELREVVGGWRDEADLEQRAQALRRALAVGHLLLTRSEEGMTLFGEGSVLHVPAQAREVFDVSGAGDTVAAVLAASLAAGRPMPDAVRLANRAGGIVVGKLGTASVSPDELFGDGA
ncbi:MAG TPA: D-glycero-beta-D-manno-heptose-7-phosphate kinase [Burkholderiaceae bacterium]|mgnify:CR=1 FL=1|nr:D-glycero-beta-D-manno-heptose-7-phosphate kinase [Burkholderiaceae bacterium]